MLHLCHLCQSPEYLLEQFSKFNENSNLREEEDLHSLINYGLNPIAPILYEIFTRKKIGNEIEKQLLIRLEQICQFQNTYQRKQELNHDYLYGWDYLINYFISNVKFQQSHFNLFKQIINKTHEYNQFDVDENLGFLYYMEQINKKCQILFKEFRQDDIQQLKQLKEQSQITDRILKFRVYQFDRLFTDIERIVFLHYHIPQLNQEFYQEYIRNRIIILSLMQKKVDIFVSQFYLKYKNYLQTEQIGVVLLPQLNLCHKIWESYFGSLQYSQKINLTVIIIERFKTQQIPQFTLLLLAKKLKRMREYYLSLMLFSLFRKKFRNQQNPKSQYQCFIQYQMGKLCLYLKQYQESFSLYKKCIKNFNESQAFTFSSSAIFKQKILIKIIIVAIFTNHKDSRSQAIDIFLKQFVYTKNGIRASSSQATFVCYILDLLHKNAELQEDLAKSQLMMQYCQFMCQAANLTLPTYQLYKITLCQELKKAEIFQSSKSTLGTIVDLVSRNSSFRIDRRDQQSFFQQKSELKVQIPEFPQNSNLFDHFIQLQLLIYTNLSRQLDFDLYMSNKDKITVILQSMNVETLNFLPKLLNECQLTRQEIHSQKCQFHYDKLYKAHIFMYVAQFKEAYDQLKQLDIQELFQQFQITKATGKQIKFNSEYLILLTRCQIGLGEQKLPQCNDPQICFEIGCYFYNLFLKNNSQKIYYVESINSFNEAINYSHIKTNRKVNFYYQMSLNYVRHIHLIITGHTNTVQQNNNQFQIPNSNSQIKPIRIVPLVDQIQNRIGYLEDLQNLKKQRNQQQQDQIDIIIKMILKFQHYVSKMDNGLPFVRNLNDKILLYKKDNELFSLKIINIDCNENSYFQSLQSTLLEILCLLRIRELNRSEFCQLVQFKFQQNGQHVEFFLLMKYFEENTNLKYQVIQVIDAIRILNENNIFINNLSVCDIFQFNNQPILTDFSKASFEIENIWFNVQGSNNSKYQDDVYYFGKFLYEMMTGNEFNQSYNLSLIDDKRIRKIVELAIQLQSKKKTKLIELRLLM